MTSETHVTAVSYLAIKVKNTGLSACQESEIYIYLLIQVNQFSSIHAEFLFLFFLVGVVESLTLCESTN